MKGIEGLKCQISLCGLDVKSIDQVIKEMSEVCKNYVCKFTVVSLPNKKIESSCVQNSPNVYGNHKRHLAIKTIKRTILISFLNNINISPQNIFKNIVVSPAMEISFKFL